MKRNLIIVVFSVVALVAFVSLTAFTFTNLNTNEVEPIDASGL